MDTHEYAALFPSATDAELQEMASDIKQRGLLCPIITLDGKVLDGRNRLRACEIAGVKPKFETYAGADPLADVISWNLKRRHLSTSQKATLAVSLKPMFEEQARERMSEGGKRHGQGMANLPYLAQSKPSVCRGCGGPVYDGEEHRCRKTARDQAAAAVGVSGRIVQDAEHVKKHAPEVFEEVKAGRMTVNAAKQEVEKKQNDPKPSQRRQSLKRETGIPGPLAGALNAVKCELRACAARNWDRCDKDKIAAAIESLKKGISNNEID